MSLHTLALDGKEILLKGTPHIESNRKDRGTHTHVHIWIKTGRDTRKQIYLPNIGGRGRGRGRGTQVYAHTQTQTQTQTHTMENEITRAGPYQCSSA